MRLTANAPAAGAASQFHNAVLGQARRLEGVYVRALGNLQEEVLALLARGVSHPGLIRAYDFGDQGSAACTYIHPAKIPELTLQPEIEPGVVYAAGWLEGLAAGHFVRTLLPAEDLYRVDVGAGTVPALVLGPAACDWFGAWRPKPLYPTEEAVRLTKAFRRQQLAEDQGRKDAQARKRQLEDRRYQERPDVQMDKLKERVAELEQAQGKEPEAPAVPDPHPAAAVPVAAAAVAAGWLTPAERAQVEALAARK